MASVVYDNKALIPAPLINISKIYKTAEDSSRHGVLYEISLVGTLMPFRGSPSGSYPLGDPSNAFWTLAGSPPDEAFSVVDTAFSRIERKQEAIRWLFREDGKVLEWYGGPNPPIKCRPKVISITFPEGQWVDQSRYSIQLQAESLTGITDEDAFDASGLRAIAEEWQFNEVPGYDGKVYEISHNVSAQGILTFDEITGAEEPAIENAKVWVDARVTSLPDSTFVGYATNFVNWVNGGYIKNTTISEKNGSYAVSEIWTIRQAGPSETAATYIEESFTITNETENDSIKVGYAGTIFGLENQEKTGGSSAIVNAKSAIPTDAQAKTSTETSLGSLLDTFVVPIAPSQKNITINEKDATVTFSFDWSASENTDFTQGNQATISFNSSDGVYTLSLVVDIEGKGSTKTERLDNARNNIPTDSAARTIANTLVGSQIPVGVDFVGSHISKSSALNETKGSARSVWTWTDRDENNVDISVEVAFPRIIAAQLTIPGRMSGPIIQRINTASAKQITVSYRSEGHGSTKPGDVSVSQAMDIAGGIPFGLGISPWLPGSYILESDNENWNPTTGKYTRTRTHTVTEQGL